MIPAGVFCDLTFGFRKPSARLFKYPRPHWSAITCLRPRMLHGATDSKTDCAQRNKLWNKNINACVTDTRSRKKRSSRLKMTRVKQGTASMSQTMTARMTAIPRTSPTWARTTRSASRLTNSCSPRSNTPTPLVSNWLTALPRTTCTCLNRILRPSTSVTEVVCNWRRWNSGFTRTGKNTRAKCTAAWYRWHVSITDSHCLTG